MIEEVAEPAATDVDGVQPGGLRRQPLHLRRGRTRRRSSSSAPGCRSGSVSTARPPPEIAHPLPVETARGDRNAADHGRRVQGLGQDRRPRPGDPIRRAGRLPPEQQDRQRRARRRRSTTRSAMSMSPPRRSACTRPRARRSCATGWPAPAPSASSAWVGGQARDRRSARRDVPAPALRALDGDEDA